MRKLLDDLADWELILTMHKIDSALREYKKGFWWESSEEMVPFMKEQLHKFSEEISYRHKHKDESILDAPKKRGRKPKGD